MLIERIENSNILINRILFQRVYSVYCSKVFLRDNVRHEISTQISIRISIDKTIKHGLPKYPSSNISTRKNAFIVIIVYLFKNVFN